MGKQKKLLVIRLSAMGDCAMAVPVLNRFHHTYPEIQLKIITKAFFVPIFEVLPETIEVIPVYTEDAHKGVPGIIKLAKELKKDGVDEVADLHNVLRSKIIRLYYSVFGIKSAAIDKGRKEKKELTRTENKVFKQLKTTPERYASVLEDLGYKIDLNRSVEVKKPELSAKVHELIQNHDKKHIGIAPFAAHEAKTYPIDLMKEILKKLSEVDGYHLFLFGGGKEEKSKLEGLEKEFENVQSMAGKLSFEEEIQLISRLDLMVSMDSGNGHLAAMFELPVITLWGGTHPYAGFAPFNQPDENQLIPDLKKYPILPTSVFGNKQIEGYEEVMRSISPSSVVNRITEILT